MRTTVTHELAPGVIVTTSVTTPAPEIERVRNWGGGDVIVANVARLRRASEENINAANLGALETARLLAAGLGDGQHDTKEVTR